MSSFIYIISNVTDFKVGFSKDPKRRVKQLQTGNPLKLELKHTVQIEEAPVHILEKIMHHILKNKHMSGEWFSADLEEIKSLLGYVKIRYDNEETERDYKLNLLNWDF